MRTTMTTSYFGAAALAVGAFLLAGAAALSLSAMAFGGTNDDDTDDICSLPPDPGPCDGHFPRWYFNPQSGQCEMFIYGGCEGNANNFETLEECTEACGDICQLPPDPGPCDGHFPRWYFNPQSGQCEMFIYGGCEGNANNFETLEECTEACGDICQLPPDVGPCDGHFPRWYFNPQSGQCEQFIYGGCRGNANNFETLEECTEVCGGQATTVDLTGDGMVNVMDMLALLNAWGDCPAQGGCPADLTGDSVVDTLDMLMLLSEWGPST